MMLSATVRLYQWFDRLDHCQPGSSTNRPKVTSSIFTVCILPLSKLLVSSGEARLLEAWDIDGGGSARIRNFSVKLQERLQEHQPVFSAADNPLCRFKYSENFFVLFTADNPVLINAD
jgi:hypothetical protein